MADRNDSELLHRLTEEIERGWNERRDPQILFRLAREHPDVADELYEFFADVVEAEDESDRPRPDREEMDRRILSWLEMEGFAQAAAALANAAVKRSTAPILTFGPDHRFKGKWTCQERLKALLARRFCPTFESGVNNLWSLSR